MYLALVLSLMSLVHPLAQRTGGAHAFAQAIAFVVESDEPPPGMTREMGAALLVVTAWEEGRFCVGCRRGDRGVSVCTFQVRAFSERHAQQLEASPVACTRAAYATMRASVRICPDAPLAPYAGGCLSPAARAIAARRLALAASLTNARQ
jgi:hypothetical protein